MNVAEFEFPTYYSFFFKRQRTTLVTTKEVEPLIRTIFRVRFPPTPCTSSHVETVSRVVCL
jgi:hypothetical protein